MQEMEGSGSGEREDSVQTDFFELLALAQEQKERLKEQSRVRAQEPTAIDMECFMEQSRVRAQEPTAIDMECFMEQSHARAQEPTEIDMECFMEQSRARVQEPTETDMECFMEQSRVRVQEPTEIDMECFMEQSRVRAQEPTAIDMECLMEQSRVRAQEPTAIDMERWNEPSRVDEEEENDQPQGGPCTVFLQCVGVICMLCCCNTADMGVKDIDPGHIEVREYQEDSEPLLTRKSKREMTIRDMSAAVRGEIPSRAGAQEGEPKMTLANMSEKDRQRFREGKMHEVQSAPVEVDLSDEQRRMGKMEKIYQIDSDSD